jgi:hypothetical protein
MKNKYLGIFIVLSCSVLFVCGFSIMIGSVIVKYYGDRVTAIVTEVPPECDRYNSVKVLLNNKEQEVSISRPDCQEKKYKIGQQVELIKHKNFDEPVWPESQPAIPLVGILALLIIIVYTNYNKYSKVKKI